VAQVAQMCNIKNPKPQCLTVIQNTSNLLTSTEQLSPNPRLLYLSNSRMIHSLSNRT